MFEILASIVVAMCSSDRDHLTRHALVSQRETAGNHRRQCENTISAVAWVCQKCLHCLLTAIGSREEERAAAIGSGRYHRPLLGSSAGPTKRTGGARAEAHYN